MPLRTCIKCGTKVISDDRTDNFVCRNCATGGIPGIRVAVQEAPLPPVTSRTTASVTPFRCPSCQAAFASRIPAVASMTACPRCRGSLVILPDGKVETLEAYNQMRTPVPSAPVPPKAPPAPTHAPGYTTSNTESEIMDAARITADMGKTTEQLAAEMKDLLKDEEAAQKRREEEEKKRTDGEKKPAEPVKAGRTTGATSEKKPETKKLTQTSRLIKGKETAKSTQRVTPEPSSPVVVTHEKSPMFYTMLLLGPVVLSLLLLLIRHVRPLEGVLKNVGGRMAEGITKFPRKIGALTERRPAPPPQLSPKSAPGSLALSAEVMTNRAMLQWSEASNAEKYVVEISPDGNSFTELITYGNHVRSHVESMPESATYHFRVAAQNSLGKSVSNPVICMTEKVQPPPPEPEPTADQVLTVIMTRRDGISREWRTLKHKLIIEPNNPQYLGLKSEMEGRERELNTLKQTYIQKFGRESLLREFQKNGYDLNEKIIEWPLKK